MSRLLAALFMTSALAPAAAATDVVEGPEVVVTAPIKVDQDKVIQAVTVLDRAAIVETLGAGLGETLDAQPGVASTYFGAGASRPILRGLGEDRIRVLSGGLGQIDASAISPDHAVSAEGLEAERIEVLRGAAAIAYGGNAIGGVVNVIDARIAETAPKQGLSGTALASVASGLDATEGAVGATFGSGGFAVRVEGFAREAGDFDIPGFALSADKRAEEIAEHAAEGEEPPEFARGVAPNSQSQAQSGALGLSYANSRGFVGVAVKRLDTEYGIPGAHAEEEEEEPATAAFEAVKLAGEGEGEGATIDLEQTRIDLRAGLANPFPFFTRARLDLAHVDYGHVEIEPSGEVGTRFSNEGVEARVELAHGAAGGWQGVIGASGFQTDFSAIGEEAFLTPTKTRDVGLFVVQRYETGPWAIEGGARVERREIENDVAGERDFDLLSASLAGSLEPVDGLFLGLTLSRTERAPTDVELFADGPHLATGAFEVGDATLDKEVGIAAEATLRWRVGRFGLETSVYRVAFDDFVALLATGAEEDGLPVFAFSQADATFVGAEAVARVALVDRPGLTLGADFAADMVEGELDDAGKLPRIPPRTVTLGLEGAAGRFGGRLEWTDIAKQDQVAAFESETAGAQVLNARFTFKPAVTADRLTVLLDGRNLTDEEVRVHTSFVKDQLPRPGRSVRLALVAAF